MSLVIDGKLVDVPGLTTRSFLDTNDPKRPPTCVKDTFKNDRKVSGIIIHSTRGIPPGNVKKNPDGTDFISDNETAGRAYARYWAKPTGRAASAALIVCHNGTVLCISDLRDEVNWHACGANSFTIGIEMCQFLDGSFTRATLEATVKLVDFLTREFKIQRQLPITFDPGGHVHPARTIVPRLNQDNNGPAGKGFYGIWGHMHNTSNRGEGDPGSLIFDMLLNSNYEGFDLTNNEDIIIWKQRQKLLGMKNEECDGIPGTKTVEMIIKSGHNSTGLWISRPFDS